MTKITIRQVAAIAARLSGHSTGDLLGSNLKRPVAHVRQAAMWAAKQVRPELSTNQLGGVFGRDHATVIYALREVERRRLKDEAFLELTDQLLAECRLEALHLAEIAPPPLPTPAPAARPIAPMEIHWPPKGGRGKPARALKARPAAEPVEKCPQNQIEPGRGPQNDWDSYLVEPWSERKARLARERAELKAPQA